MPVPEPDKQAVERLTSRRQRDKGITQKEARKWAKAVIASKGYRPILVDPPPGKSGLIRDIGLRKAIRDCLQHHGLDPDHFSAGDIKKLCPNDDPTNWKLRMPSGVPIKSFVLLRAMSEPVVIPRKKLDMTTGKMVYSDDPASLRAYLGGNNHHIEIRFDEKSKWTGSIVSTFEAAQRKLARLKAFRQADIPRPDEFRKLSKADRKKLHPVIARIEKAHPLVDRRNNPDIGGQFAMSLCEGETLWMKHKTTQEPDYFVVAKLDKPQGIVVVPHWDARKATERKDDNNQKVANSSREQFTITPSDLVTLAPSGHDHAMKVRVDPLGQIELMRRD